MIGNTYTSYIHSCKENNYRIVLLDLKVINVERAMVYCKISKECSCPFPAEIVILPLNHGYLDSKFLKYKTIKFK